MTVKELFDSAKKRLTVSRTTSSEARETVLIIFENLKGWSLTDILVKGDQEASNLLVSRVNETIERILSGEPVQYIFESAHFYGMVFKVTPKVLIPRPETAQLVDMIVDENSDKSDLKVLDIATGSGCIAIALARNLPFSQVTAIDISADALQVAKENARKFKTNITFIEDDALKLSEPQTPCFNIIVSNPPYITQKEAADMERNVLEHEPHLALFVPDDNPLLFYKAISDYAQQALVDGGRLYFEINPLFAEKLKRELVANGWNNVELHRDMQGAIRFATAVK